MCASTTSAPTRYTAIWRWMIRRVSRKTRRTVLQARTAPRRRRPTIWCAHGCVHTVCAPPSPTAPTTMARTSMWRSSFHGRSPPSWRARGRNCTAPARTCATLDTYGRPLSRGVGDSHPWAHRRNVSDRSGRRDEQHRRAAHDPASDGSAGGCVRLGAGQARARQAIRDRRIQTARRTGLVADAHRLRRRIM